MKRNILAAITLLAMIFCESPGYAEAAPLTWVQMETQEEVSETVLPQSDKTPPQETAAKEQKDVSGDSKSQDGDYLAKAIDEIMKRRQDDDKLLTALLSERKKAEKAQKEQEEARKRQEEAKKKQEQQKLFDNLTQTLQKQKDEENQKLTTALKVLTQQQTEQTSNVTALINTLKEEQAKREQREQEQQAVLNEITVSNVVKSINSIQTAPAPAINITPVKRTLQESIADSTQDVTQAAFREADATFFYSPGSLYKIYCKEGFVTDIRLQPGEDIQYIGGGDTVRWVIDQAQSGSGNNKTWHIYLKPMKTGLTTNIIINTDKHSYQLHVESTDWYTPIVNWTYPQEEKAAFYRAQSIAQKHEEENLGAISLDSLNFNYTIAKGNSYDWAPTEIFDDGTKTYIKMPEAMSKTSAPVLFVKDGKNLALVNYRLKNGMYVVDRLFKEAELRNGSEIVKIKKTK